MIIGFIDENRSDALGLRFAEKLEGFDESMTISEQTQSNQDIISKYTSVIDSLNSKSTETTSLQT